MRALLLAAGFGSRLSRVTRGGPKVLVPVAGEPLVQRSARLLAAAGIEELVVVLGYRGDDVREALECAPLPVRFVENNRYAEFQNYYSVMLARPFVEDEPFVSVNGDVLFEPALLDRVISWDSPLGVAIDEANPLNEEAMKVQIDDRGIVRSIGKWLPVAASFGEAMGIWRFDPASARKAFDALEERALAGERTAYYEDVYHRAIGSHGLAFEPIPVGGLRWAEIDDENDLLNARMLFEPEARVAAA